jgi:sporulation protein YlmC with PRC-barrel domain
MTMKLLGIFLSGALLSGLMLGQARAECQIADAKLEEAILHQENLRGSANRQSVRDLRRLRDAALILQSYGRDADCERLLGNIRELISGPAMTTLGDSDEDNAEKQMDAREPQAPRGGTLGHRSDKNAQPLLSIENLSPALRTDEIIGAEVRSSNDKIVGEVRSVVLDFKDHRDYAIVASGGFFTPGKESIVVPVLSLRVSQNRQSFFLPMPDSDVKKVPLMPGDDYKWLSDAAWRARNDALFVRP